MSFLIALRAALRFTLSVSFSLDRTSACWALVKLNGHLAMTVSTSSRVPAKNSLLKASKSLSLMGGSLGGGGGAGFGEGDHGRARGTEVKRMYSAFVGVL